MASTIAAITTGVGGVVTTADATGNLNLLAGTTTIVALTTAGAAVTGTLSASGITTVAAGSAALPAIVSTTGTADTGLWFPAADTVAASTAGTERLRINSSGNVGIGTNSPSVKLDVTGSIKASVSVTSASDFIGGGASGYAALYGDGAGGLVVCRGSSSTNDIEFSTNSTERMRIDASGNVGIGTNSPGEFIHLYKPSGDLAFRIQTSAGNCYVVNRAATSAMDLLNAMNGPMTFATNNTERMRIDSSGRVTKPYQPIFMGAPTNDYSAGGAPTQDIPFTAIYNNGSHYNVANSRFTAPIAGWYRTTWGGLQLSATVTSLKVNGSRVHNGNHYLSASVSYASMHTTAIRYLNASDYMTVESWNTGGYFNDWFIWTVDLIA